MIFALLFVPTSIAETTCSPAQPGDCTILITVNIAFSFNDSEISWNTVQGWMDEAEKVWNGPGGNQVYGECGCKVRFQINAVKITDPAQANCNPGPVDHHCIMITDYDKSPPKNEAGDETYRAYMYGTAGRGQSINGWWSDAVGTPHPDSPSGQNAEDAAHEIGHMLGLDDDYDKGPPERYGANIMGTTHGNDAEPTQEQIDGIVEKFCGEGACPDECCCGNGEVDKEEECDPFADPNGCEEGQTCCKLFCGCHDSFCVPENGEYGSSDHCQKDCKDGSCYFNYNTGCWDCVKHNVTVTPTPADSVTPSPGSADSVTPKGGADLSGVLGALGILIGAGLALAGFKTQVKLVMVMGIIIALLSLMMLIMQPLALPPEPMDVPAPPSEPGPGINTVRPMVTVQTFNPKPEPAKDPDEEVLKDRINDLEDDISLDDVGDIVDIPVIDGDSNDAGLNGESTCDDNRIEGCPCSVYKWCKVGYECVNKICQIEIDPVCGDDVCEGLEDCDNCEDCTCDNDEVCEPDNDEADKSGCVDEENLEPYCGDDMCDPASGETCECEDCEDVCPIGMYCSPGMPDADELGCSIFGGSSCGNGLCEETEYCYTCPIDCLCGPETCCSPSNGGIGCGADCSWSPF